MFNRQHLKAIVWPRPPTESITQYRYVIIGMLVADEPIQSLEGKNKSGISEFLLNGTTYGMAELLDLVHKGTPNQVHGEAGNWLVSLADVEIYEDTNEAHFDYQGEEDDIEMYEDEEDDNKISDI